MSPSKRKRIQSDSDSDSEWEARARAPPFASSSKSRLKLAVPAKARTPTTNATTKLGSTDKPYTSKPTIKPNAKGKGREATPPSSFLPPTPAIKFTGGEPTAPSLKEWKKMTPYQSFIVVDPKTYQEHTFSLKTYALILPEGSNPKKTKALRLRDYWVGKIHDIRSRGTDVTEVWVSTQWMMSAQDMLGYKLKKKLDPSQFGTMERILSNHYDFVHTQCFAGHANVIPYVESESEPEAIGDETFYYRYTFDVFTQEVKGPSPEPHLPPTPLPSAYCLCDEPYNANESSLMHFCPRKGPGCGRAFHRQCLKRKGYVEETKGADVSMNREKKGGGKTLWQEVVGSGRDEMVRIKRRRARALERACQQSDLEDELDLGRVNIRSNLNKDYGNETEGIGVHVKRSGPGTSTAVSRTEQKQRRPSTPSSASPGIHDHSNDDDDVSDDESSFKYDYDLIPPPLLALARSPMIKGIGSELPYEWSSVTGNYAPVMRARRLVRQIGMKRTNATKWRDEIKIPGLAAPSVVENARDERENAPKVESEKGKTKVKVKRDSEEKFGEEERDEKFDAKMLEWVAKDEGLLCPGCLQPI